GHPGAGQPSHHANPRAHPTGRPQGRPIHHPSGAPSDPTPTAALTEVSLDPTYLGYRAASSMARLLPAAAVLPLSRVSGLMASKVMRGRAEMVARHQQRVRGALTDRQLADAVRSVFVSYAHYWIESFRLPGTSPEALDSGFTHSGWHHIQDVIDSGRSVVLAMPHLGAWEWAGFWTTEVQGIPVTTVVEAVEPPELAEWFTGLRREFGFDIIPLGPEA